VTHPVVDYASELEEEAEAQQARRLAEMETELGVLPWMPGRNRRKREARCGAGGPVARRRGGGFLSCVRELSPPHSISKANSPEIT